MCSLQVKVTAFNAAIKNKVVKFVTLMLVKPPFLFLFLNHILVIDVSKVM